MEKSSLEKDQNLGDFVNGQVKDDEAFTEALEFNYSKDPRIKTYKFSNLQPGK